MKLVTKLRLYYRSLRDYNKNKDIKHCCDQVTDYFFVTHDRLFEHVYTYRTGHLTFIRPSLAIRIDELAPKVADNEFFRSITRYLTNEYDYKGWIQYKVFREKVIQWIQTNEIRSLDKIDEPTLIVFKLALLK